MTDLDTATRIVLDATGVLFIGFFIPLLGWLGFQIIRAAITGNVT